MLKNIKISNLLFSIAIVVYLANILGILLTVFLNSISKYWYGELFPKYITLEWYRYMVEEHNLPQLLFVTFFVVIMVAIISLLIGFLTAYVLARYDFRLKSLFSSALLLPVILPPMTYGIPLAALLYRLRLANNLSGVVIANLVPIVPFVTLVLTPFIEQISVNLESAARTLGASKLQTFFRILIPLSLPGILTATILAIVRTIAMFELTFLVAGARTQTIIVALYYDAYAAGTRPPQVIDALAIVYFLITVTLLGIALKFVSPTQMVFRVK
jgi:putative spermidine/putrescine transport system permease protein